MKKLLVFIIIFHFLFPLNAAELTENNATLWGSVSGNLQTAFADEEHDFRIGLTATNYQSPDLTIFDIDLTESSTIPSSVYVITCRVLNSGKASAGTSFVGFYLSTDANYSTNDTFIGKGAVSALAPGANSVEATFYTMPTSLPAGIYYILFRADIDNEVNESNENNNVSSIEVTVKPDLVVINETAAPTAAAPGGLISTTCTVKNQGNGPAGYSYLRYYLSTNNTYDNNDTYLGYDFVGGLTSGQTSDEDVSFNLPSTLTSGTYYILFRADNNDKVDESNENNNLTYIQITVTPTSNIPDLRIANQSATSTSTAGGLISATCTVNNNGTGTSVYSYLRYYLSTNTTVSMDDTYLGNDYVNGLSAGSSSIEAISATLPTTLVAGTYYILFQADASNRVDETNENNNLSYVQITITGTNSKPDLRIRGGQVSPNPTTAGGTIIPQCVIENYGNGNAGVSYLRYYLSNDTNYSSNDLYLGSDYVKSLTPGSFSSESITVTLPTTLTVGTYYLFFRVDYDDRVDESNENNNLGYLPIEIIIATNLPDLRVTNQSATPTTTTPGGSINANCRVYNNGAATSGYSYLRYYLSTNTTYSSNDTYLGYDYVKGLQVGSYSYESIPITLPTTLVAGTYYLLFRADYSDRVDESNENNNVRYIKITVIGNSAKPDLEAFFQTANPTSGVPGTTVNTVCRIRNNGSVTAGSSRINWYLSTNATYSSNDQLLGSQFVGTVSSSTTLYKYFNFSIPSVSAGTYYILYRVDANQQVAESNESNNIVYKSITIGATPFTDHDDSSTYRRRDAATNQLLRNEDLTMRVFPNPVSSATRSKIEILAPQPIGQFHLTISNLQGKVIYSKTFSTEGKSKFVYLPQINVEGVYLVTIQSEIGSVTKKLLVFE